MVKEQEQNNIRSSPPPYWVDELKGKPNPVLRFTPYAWGKLLFMRNRSEMEVGGFGITSRDNLLLVEDLILPKQKVSCGGVDFDDEGIRDYFNQMVDQDREPEQFGRIFIHTHPGNSPSPSSTDEETFLQVFGRCSWAIMFILARNDDVYTRLTFTAGPGLSHKIEVEVDYQTSFSGSNSKEWTTHYQENISKKYEIVKGSSFLPPSEVQTYDPYDPYDIDNGYLSGYPGSFSEEFTDEVNNQSSDTRDDILDRVLSGQGSIEDVKYIIKSLPPKMQGLFQNKTHEDKIDLIEVYWDKGLLDNC